MSSRNARFPNHPAVVATIDLHGYTKSAGISSLTSFLDRVSSKQKGKPAVFVLVITGSGAHSHEGPVLRSAVQALLERRKMKYTVNKGKGSFTVNANSGFVLYEPGVPTDTKLLIKDAPQQIPSLPKPGQFPRFAATPMVENNDPTPQEVAVTDRAIVESRKHQQRDFQQHKKEEKAMKRAVSMSLLQAEKEKEDDENVLARALSMSVLDCRPDPDDELLKVLALSESDFQKSAQEEDEELKRALELSQQVSRRDDEELLRALQLSKETYSGP